jgi:AcrR family transcriptional regulator
MATRGGPAEKKGAHGAMRWVQLPMQARSQEKLERFVAAAERLIDEKGFQATSVPEIAREAGCSVGLFYTRFRDKSELLRYLVEHYLDEVLATARQVLRPELWDGVPLADMVAAFVRGIVAIHRRRAGLVYAFYENVRVDPVIAKRVVAVHREAEGLARDLLASRAAEMTHRDPETAVRFGTRLVIGFLQQRAVIGAAMPQEENLSWELVADELVRALSGYLGVATPGEPAAPIAPRDAQQRRRLHGLPGRPARKR